MASVDGWTDVPSYVNWLVPFTPSGRRCWLWCVRREAPRGNRIMAIFLVLLASGLCHGVASGLGVYDRWPSFRAADGHADVALRASVLLRRPLDDVIVYAHDASGVAAVLAIQAKRKIAFCPGDEVFRDAHLRGEPPGPKDERGRANPIADAKHEEAETGFLDDGRSGSVEASAANRRSDSGQAERCRRFRRGGRLAEHAQRFRRVELAGAARESPPPGVQLVDV